MTTPSTYPSYPPQPQPPQPPQLRNGLGTAALTLGIIGVVLAFIPVIGWSGIILGILATVFGAIGRGRVKRGKADNGGMALTGIITGPLAIVISVLMTVLVFAAVDEAADDWNDYADCVDHAQTTAQLNQCDLDY